MEDNMFDEDMFGMEVYYPELKREIYRKKLEEQNRSKKKAAPCVLVQDDVQNCLYLTEYAPDYRPSAG